MKKLHMGQNLIIAALAILLLFSLLISVLAFVPANTDVEIREEIRVSSSRINAESDPTGAYIVEFSGALRNTTDEIVKIECLTVPADGSDRDVDAVLFKVENIVIAPRSTVTVSASAASAENCTKTGDVSILLGGEEFYLRNPAESNLTAALIPLLVSVIVAVFLIRAVKIRYYMAQEDKADAEALEAL